MEGGVNFVDYVPNPNPNLATYEVDVTRTNIFFFVLYRNKQPHP
jgi:hypothetical protein